MITVGYAITGSFCTFEKSIKEIELLSQKGYSILPIMSFNAYKIDTRFGKAQYFIERIENIAQRKIISTIEEAEPIGPKKMCDVLVVSPCTGNTLSKIANCIYDTPVTLAVKSHLRNEKPVLIGISTNDALKNSASNIGTLMNLKHIYFIPFKQDNYKEKPYSVVCDFSLTLKAVEAALSEKQIQPIMI